MTPLAVGKSAIEDYRPIFVGSKHFFEVSLHLVAHLRQLRMSLNLKVDGTGDVLLSKIVCWHGINYQHIFFLVKPNLSIPAS